MASHKAFRFTLATALAATATLFASPPALAQSASDIVGTWILVSSYPR